MTLGPHHPMPETHTERPKRRNKYRAIKQTVDGHKFDSKAEARRYGQLKLLTRAGEISGLSLQPKFDLTAHGRKIGTYRADFTYSENGNVIVEDVKSKATAKGEAYRLRIKLFLANFPDLKFREVINGVVVEVRNG